MSGISFLVFVGLTFLADMSSVLFGADLTIVVSIFAVIILVLLTGIDIHIRKPLFNIKYYGLTLIGLMPIILFLYFANFLGVLPITLIMFLFIELHVDSKEKFRFIKELIILAIPITFMLLFFNLYPEDYFSFTVKWWHQVVVSLLLVFNLIYLTYMHYKFRP